jgi:hypothetical protein
VQVGAVHRHAVELGEHLGVGVAVAVAGAHADEDDAGTHGTQEPGGVGVATVMGDLENGGAQPLGPLQQPQLRRLLGISGQQDRAVRVPDPQHERVFVEVVGEAAVRGWAEDLDPPPTEGEALARGHRPDRHPPLLRPQVGLDRRRRQAVTRPQGRRPDDQGPDVEPLEDGRQSPAVVVVGVGQRHEVEAAHTAVPEQRRGAVRVGAAVHEHA